MVREKTGNHSGSDSEPLRKRLLAWVNSGTETVVRFQRFFGLTPKSHNPVITAVFKFGAALGDEVFWITFLPLMLWSDAEIATRVFVLWMAQYYTGQVIKDLLRLPRPPSPPVVRLEQHYETEYGMPSTHCMGAVSLPFYIAALVHDRHNVSSSLTLAVAVCWCLTTCLSRLYLGVHSPADVITGSILGVTILGFWRQIDDSVMHWIMNHPTAPVWFSLCIITILALYPKPERWTSAYGDTVTALTSAAAATISERLFFQTFGYDGSLNGISRLDPETTATLARNSFFGAFPVLKSTIDTYPLFALLIRVSIGFVLMLTVRAVTKKVMWTILPPIGQSLGLVPLSNTSLKNAAPTDTRTDKRKQSEKRERSLNTDGVVVLQQLYVLEIPAKFAVYGSVGFVAGYPILSLFQYLGI